MRLRPWAWRGPHDREIRILALPALGSLIADPLLSIVDTAFIGRVGTDELGALGVASAVFAVAFFAFNFLEYGTTAMVARAFGAGELDRAGRATVTAFGLAAISGLLVLAVLEAAVGPIVSAMGADDAVADAARTYIRIRALATPAVLVVRAAHGAYRGYQDTRTPFLISLAINGINLVLDPLLIFGADMGVAGAAWATVVAQWLGALGFAWFVLVRSRERFGITRFRPRPAELRAFALVGRDLVVRTGSLLAAFTVAAAVAARISDDAIAAHQVMSQIFVFLALGVDALAIAGQALIGRYLGAGDRERAAAVSDRLVVGGVLVGLALLAVLAVVSGPLPGWFTDDAAVVAEIRAVFWFVALSQPLVAVVFVWDGVFIGAGDFTFLAGAMFAAAAASIGIMALVLPLGWSLAGVWWALMALMAVRVVTLAWRRLAPSSPLRS